MEEEMYSLQEELNRIKELEADNPNEALQRYSALLEWETGEKGEVFYHFGCFLHTFAEEEMAVELLVQAYNAGVCRKEILDLLLQDFWEPNKNVFQEAYLYQTGELLRLQRELEIPDFGVLPYYMFPVSDSRVMVYDRRKERFSGWLDPGADLEKKNLKEPEVFFPVIMDMGNSSLQDLLCYFYQNRARRIYILEKENEWLGLLMILDILRKMPSVVPLKGTGGAAAFFRESMCRLPEIVRIEEEDTALEIKECLQKEHERRIRRMKKEKKQPLLTIGIPSWNRGERAKGLVEKLCKLPYDVDLEILVSNNGSDKGAESYHAIRDMQDGRISYTEFEENRMYYGNIAQVFRKAAGKWVLLLSDEDEVIPEQLQDYMAKLEQFQEKVAVIRPGSTIQYQNLKEDYQQAGEDACAAYSLHNTYMSGATYNRKFMTNELVDKIEKKWTDNYTYQIYAHMIYDWYMCLKGDFYQYAPVLVLQGEMEDMEENKDMAYEYNKFNNRMRQFDGYLDIINGLEEATEREKIFLFISVSAKTIVLLCMLRENYKKECGSWETCQKRVAEQIGDGYKRLNVSLENRILYKEDVEKKIQSAINQFGF